MGGVGDQVPALVVPSLCIQVTAVVLSDDVPSDTGVGGHVTIVAISVI